MADKKQDHLEHRRRLRTRFLRDDGDAMPDYEILELLLAMAIPRRDVKPFAKALLRKFGSFANVISAPPVELAACDGVGDGAITALKLVRASAIRLLRQESMARTEISSWQQLIDFCHAAMARERVEQLRVLFLNNRNMLILDEILSRGTVNHTPLYPREIARRALELHASAVILVHNHPSGNPTPSQADIRMTGEVAAALKAISVTLHDHVVIASEGHVSFRGAGYL